MTAPDSVPVPTPDTAARIPHTREDHQALLEVWHSGKGFMRHRYRRCGFSGAGNCCCGRPKESPLHPHPFSLSQWGKERGRWLCVCGKDPDHAAHQKEAKSA